MRRANQSWCRLFLAREGTHELVRVPPWAWVAIHGYTVRRKRCDSKPESSPSAAQWTLSELLGARPLTESAQSPPLQTRKTAFPTKIQTPTPYIGWPVDLIRPGIRPALTGTIQLKMGSACVSHVLVGVPPTSRFVTIPFGKDAAEFIGETPMKATGTVEVPDLN